MASIVAMVAPAVLGAAGLVVVAISMVAQILSVGWALLAGVAAALVAASAGLAVVVAVRRGPHVASRVVARPVEVATAQQTKEIERAVARPQIAAPSEAEAEIVFEIPPDAAGGSLALSPEPEEEPDAGYRAHAVPKHGKLALTAKRGLHPRHG